MRRRVSVDGRAAAGRARVANGSRERERSGAARVRTLREEGTKQEKTGAEREREAVPLAFGHSAKGTKKEKTQPQPAQVQVIQTTVVETFSARASARGSKGAI